jgi:WD40 repeat protein
VLGTSVWSPLNTPGFALPATSPFAFIRGPAKVRGLRAEKQFRIYHGVSFIVSASNDKTLKVWEALTAKLLSTLRGHTGEVPSVAWSPDGKTLASGSGDWTVKLLGR